MCESYFLVIDNKDDCRTELQQTLGDLALYDF
jgi:hypothetical protein